MSLPNASIASAFIESYITIRKSKWYLDIGGEAVKIPDDAKVKHKVALCVSMLELFKTAKTYDDWIKVLDDIFAKERAEFETQKQRFAFVRAVTNDPLAGFMLHAIRTYIISEMKTEREFIRQKEEHNKRRIELEKQIMWDKGNGTIQATIDANQRLLDEVNRTLETRDDLDEYYKDFFAKHIIPEDSEAKRLDEKTFGDYKENVVRGNRKLVICERILEDSSKKKVETPELTSTSNGKDVGADAAATAPAVEKKDDQAPGRTASPDVPPPALVPTGDNSDLQTLSTFASKKKPAARGRKAAGAAAPANPDDQHNDEHGYGLRRR